MKLVGIRDTSTGNIVHVDEDSARAILKEGGAYVAVTEEEADDAARQRAAALKEAARVEKVEAKAQQVAEQEALAALTLPVKAAFGPEVPVETTSTESVEPQNPVVSEESKEVKG